MIKLKPIQESEKENFIKNIQTAFKKSAIDEFGDSDEEIISRKEVIESFEMNGAETFNILLDEKIVGGIVVKIDRESNRNELILFFVNVDCHSRGIGSEAWNQIEKMYPETKIWETVTPYFEKRNLHFYINKCGFHIVEFFNPQHPDPNQDSEIGGDYFFRFEKVMK